MARIFLILSMILGLGWHDGFSEARSHPFYVSVCQIDFNSETRTLEIAIKIFTDDLERALEETTDKRLHLGTPREYTGSNEIIERYFRDHFRIQLNGSPIDLKYLGKEVEIDATWCFIESNKIPSPGNKSSDNPVPSLPTGTIVVTNRVLLETFENQANIVHIKIGDQRKSLLLSNALETDSVTF